MFVFLFSLLSYFLNMQVSNDSVYLGQEVDITLNFIYSREFKFNISEDSSSWLPLTLSEPVTKILKTRGEDSIQVVYYISGAFYRSIDSAVVTPPPLYVYSEDTMWIDTVPGYKFTILSTLTGETDTLPSPLRPRLDFPPIPPVPLHIKILKFIFKYWYYFLLIDLIIAALFMLYYFIKRKTNTTEIPIDPRRKALLNLFSLKELFFLSNKIFGKQFYTSLLDIFKEYTENYTSLPIKNMTLREIEKDLIKSLDISSEIDRSLIDFHKTAELAKFSKYDFSNNIGKKDWESIKEFIETFPEIIIGDKDG